MTIVVIPLTRLDVGMSTSSPTTIYEGDERLLELRFRVWRRDRLLVA
jgi:hypothetical protein